VLDTVASLLMWDHFLVPSYREKWWPDDQFAGPSLAKILIELVTIFLRDWPGTKFFSPTKIKIIIMSSNIYSNDKPDEMPSLLINK